MAGIYVHIPFCEEKCKYCDFLSFAKNKQGIKKKYVEDLIREIKETEESFAVDTIYIGGGTPSVLELHESQKILEAIYECLRVKSDAEITIEVNPGTVNFEKLISYKKMGINRLSIGLQAVQDRILKLLRKNSQI